MLNRLVAFLFFALVSVAASHSEAALITVKGSGTFGSADSSNAAYQPNATFSFSFQIENPLDDNPTYNLTNATYTVDGTSIATPIVVQFFNLLDGGLFALGFDNGGSLSLFGPDIGSTGTLIGGPYQGAVYGSASDYGSASLSVGTVPLPPSLPMFGGGLVLFIVIHRRKRTTLRDVLQLRGTSGSIK